MVRINYIWQSYLLGSGKFIKCSFAGYYYISEGSDSFRQLEGKSSKENTRVGLGAVYYRTRHTSK